MSEDNGLFQQDEEEKKAPDSAAVEEKRKKAKMKEEVKPQKTSAFTKFIRFVLAFIAFLGIGAGLVYFLVHLPAASEFKDAQTELARLEQVESDYVQLQSDYRTLQERYALADLLVDIFKIQNNVNVARIALLEDDQIALSQSLAFVEENINSLDISPYPDVNIDLKARFDAVKNALPKDEEKALFELGRLHEDLLRLANNLEK